MKTILILDYSFHLTENFFYENSYLAKFLFANNVLSINSNILFAFIGHINERSFYNAVKGDIAPLDYQ